MGPHRFSTYVSWLVFIVALIVAVESLGKVNLFRFYQMPWLDVAASYGLLGSIGVVAALAASALCSLVDRGASRLGWQAVRRAPMGMVFAIFVTVWLRLLLAVFTTIQVRWPTILGGIDLAHVPLMPALILFLVLGLTTFGLFATRLSQWMEETSGRLRSIGWAASVVFVGLACYIVVDLFRAGPPVLAASRGPGAQPPNVIIIVLDGLTSRDMDLYGYRLPTTPHLDRLSETWTVFEGANSTGTGTSDVMPGILTGRYTYLHAWHRYGDLASAGRGWLSLPQILKGMGYETGYVMGGGFSPSHYHLQEPFDWIIGGNKFVGLPGRDLLNRTVFTEFALPDFSKPGVFVDEPMYEYAEQYFRRRVASRATAPLFVYMHMNRPHYPFLGDEFLGTFLPVDAGLADIASQQPYLFAEVSADQQSTIDRLRLRYDENILKADAEVGHVIDVLKELNLYDQSLVVITADHGTSFSEIQGYYTPLLKASEHRIPLLVKFPGQTHGRRVAGLVSNVDILPTVVDVVGASYQSALTDGQSLRGDDRDDQRVVYVRLPSEPRTARPTAAVLCGSLKLVRRHGGLLLYDLPADPDERHNLGEQPLAQPKVKMLREALEQSDRRIESLEAGQDIEQAPSLITTVSSAEPCAMHP